MRKGLFWNFDVLRWGDNMCFSARIFLFRDFVLSKLFTFSVVYLCIFGRFYGYGVRTRYIISARKKHPEIYFFAFPVNPCRNVFQIQFNFLDPSLYLPTDICYAYPTFGVTNRKYSALHSLVRLFFVHLHSTYKSKKHIETL